MIWPTKKINKKNKAATYVTNEAGITIELGEDKCYLVIWNDSKITEVLHPANVIGNFSWCLEIKDKDNNVMGYLAA